MAHENSIDNSNLNGINSIDFKLGGIESLLMERLMCTCEYK